MGEIIEMIDDLAKEMDSKQMRDLSLVANGQRMANALKWFIKNYEGYDGATTKKCIECRELIQRWEKEFINPKKDDSE